MAGRVWDVCFDAPRWQRTVQRLDAELEVLRTRFDGAPEAAEHASGAIAFGWPQGVPTAHRVTIECRQVIGTH